MIVLEVYIVGIAASKGKGQPVVGQFDIKSISFTGTAGVPPAMSAQREQRLVIKIIKKATQPNQCLA